MADQGEARAVATSYIDVAASSALSHRLWVTNSTDGGCSVVKDRTISIVARYFFGRP